MKTVVGYNPYLYVMGGGEAYFLRALTAISGAARVVLEEASLSPFSREDIIGMAMSYHGIDLSGIEIMKHGSISGADVYLSMHNSSFICSKSAMFNISIVQVPARFEMSETFPGLIVFNSDFTKHHWTRINKLLPCHAEVITPPVHVMRKDVVKQSGFDIITIGRFGEKLHNKREDRLLSIFKKLRSSLPGIDVRLHLVGITTLLGLQQDAIDPYREEQIFVHQDICRTELYSLLSKADLFWNSTGFEIDENEFPEKVEHFGMAIAEALVCGTVPIIQPKGGAAEKLTPWINFIPWEKEEDLITNTVRLIQDQELLHSVKTNIETTDWYSIFNNASQFQEKWAAAFESKLK